MFASFIATGLGLSALLVLPVLMFTSVLGTRKDVDQLDPHNCHDCDF